MHSMLLWKQRKLYSCVNITQSQLLLGLLIMECLHSPVIVCRCRRSLSRDRRSEPLVGQRVPYVIVYGMPGLPLIQLVRCPHDVLADTSLRINATYYITKQILPSLGRIFSLMGVDVMKWYSDLPRVTRSVLVNRSTVLGIICSEFDS